MAVLENVSCIPKYIRMSDVHQNGNTKMLTRWQNVLAGCHKKTEMLARHKNVIQVLKCFTSIKTLAGYQNFGTIPCIFS